MKKVDFKKLSNNFIKKNEWIIYYSLSKCPWVFDDKDLMQEARIWLCKAKIWYDPKRGTSWKTFASNLIKQEYSRVFNKINKKRSDPELNGFSNVGLDAIRECDLYNLCKNINNDFLYKDNEILYNSLLEKIPEGRSKEIVILYTLGWSHSDIAKRFDITKQRTWQLYKIEIDKLKKLIKE